MGAEPGATLVRGPGWAILSMKGEIDVNTAPEYEGPVLQILEDAPQVVVVNLSLVTFMDSSGLGLIASLARLCQEGDGTVYLVDASAMVRATLAACGLDQYVTLVAAADPRLPAPPL